MYIAARDSGPSAAAESDTYIIHIRVSWYVCTVEEDRPASDAVMIRLTSVVRRLLKLNVQWRAWPWAAAAAVPWCTSWSQCCWRSSVLQHYSRAGRLPHTSVNSTKYSYLSTLHITSLFGSCLFFSASEKIAGGGRHIWGKVVPATASRRVYDYRHMAANITSKLLLLKFHFVSANKRMWRKLFIGISLIAIFWINVTLQRTHLGCLYSSSSDLWLIINMLEKLNK